MVLRSSASDPGCWRHGAGALWRKAPVGLAVVHMFRPPESKSSSSLVDVSAWEAGQAAQSIDFINPLIAGGCGPSPSPANQRRRADESLAQPPSRLFLSSNNLPRQPALVWSARAPVASIASKARMWGRAPSASPAGPFPFATPDEHPAENPSLHLLSTFCRLAAGLRLDAL